ncbi:mitochondrial 18 KDa protein-domain-containing protein [Tirmania nivea]|nr:mitochondrial 18 KDa protein-domain-containing protein [Tirmania nivea]
MGLRDYLPSPPPPATPGKPPATASTGSNTADDGVLERIYEGEAGESTDSNIRYAAYGMRIRTLLSATHRYVAYTSDIGESFRPVAHPWLVKGAYGISWAYITGDVAYEGYKAYLNNQAVKAGLPPPHPIPHHHKPHPPTPTATTTATLQESKAPSSVLATVTTTQQNKVPLQDDYRTIAAERFIFQTLASMALPAFTIHSIVRYSGRAMKNVKSPRLRTWGPVGLGLAVVPALPYLFDEPVERAVEKGVEVLVGLAEGRRKEVVNKEANGGREL